MDGGHHPPIAPPMLNDYFFKNSNNDISIRTNPDLIECVKALQEKHKGISFSYKKKPKIRELEVVKVEIEVEDFHDGIEKVSVASYID